ncbi:hypothetical protein [uncultured Desulfovibrio sp.]|uniref:hypothetical protein n=1 Tax=uncultured Desulfovibrio sp. TaxID=167968 RepID=UPI002625377C|nr:hypothetical protein [uncultured Desulfovibrio sp.]
MPSSIQDAAEAEKIVVPTSKKKKQGDLIMQKMREGKITALSEVKGVLLSVLMFYLGAVLAKTRSHFIIPEKVMKIV